MSSHCAMGRTRLALCLIEHESTKRQLSKPQVEVIRTDLADAGWGQDVSESLWSCQENWFNGTSGQQMHSFACRTFTSPAWMIQWYPQMWSNMTAPACRTRSCSIRCTWKVPEDDMKRIVAQPPATPVPQSPKCLQVTELWHWIISTFYTSEWNFWGHAWSTKGSVLRLEAVERTANDTLPCLWRKHVTCNLTPVNWLWGVAILPVPFSGLAAIWVWWAGALGALWQSEVKAHRQRIAENSRLLQMLLSNTLGIKLRYMSDCYCSVWNIFLRRQGWMQF